MTITPTGRENTMSHDDSFTGAPEEDTLIEIYKEIDSGDDKMREEATDDERLIALSISEKRVLDVLLSVSSPRTGIKIELDGDEIDEVTHYSSWDGHETVSIEIAEGTTFWRYAKRVVEIHRAGSGE